MSIITISRGSFSYGKEISEKVAASLGYACVSREILLETSRHFIASEKKLLHSIHDAPSIIERIMHGRDKYLLSIRATLLEHAGKGDLVYCGHAGHLLIPELGQVLKVRIIVNNENRISLMQRTENVSREEAISFLKKEDKQRELWTRYLYNVNIENPRLYDMILHVENLTTEDACEIICAAEKRKAYHTTRESFSDIRDMALASHVKALLYDISDVDVKVNDGKIFIKVPKKKIRSSGVASSQLRRQVQDNIQENVAKSIMDALQTIPGVKDIACEVETPFYS